MGVANVEIRIGPDVYSRPQPSHLCPRGARVACYSNTATPSPRARTPTKYVPSRGSAPRRGRATHPRPRLTPSTTTRHRIRYRPIRPRARRTEREAAEGPREPDAARADLRAFTAFPKQIWFGPRKRLNKDIRRRADVAAMLQSSYVTVSSTLHGRGHVAHPTVGPSRIASAHHTTKTSSTVDRLPATTTGWVIGPPNRIGFRIKSVR